jgi:lipid-binding SYLF domain-containing protein
MEDKKRQRVNVGIVVLAILTVGTFLASYTPAFAADRAQVQGLVDRARVTFSNFMRDQNYVWLHQSLDNAKGVLIFPQIIKGGFVFGASGGTGVFLVRDKKTTDWSEPAFYSLGSLTFGFQIGGEAAEVIMLAMTQKAVDSLLSSSFKLGGDVSIAIGPVGAGAKANADIPSVTADFLAFTKAKGLYGGLNLEGTVVAVRDGLNEAYYGKSVRPADIIVGHAVRNKGADELRAILACGPREGCG